ncbi:MAG: zinc ABC transporter substrate-binding protein [Actinobacteria bacterium]|nr:zinc ABC transporter substrate-binding protein [Actinomycetota bacterium]
MKSGLVIATVAVSVIGSCSDAAPTTAGERLRVAVSFFPIAEVVRRVSGDAASDEIEITTLVPPGEEAHEYDPTARQITHLEDADVVFFLGNDFQPNIEKAIASLPGTVVRSDLLENVEMLDDGDDADTHVWLDPMNMATMARTAAQVLSDAIPALAGTFANNAATYIRELAELDELFAVGLSECDSTLLLTTHRAFAYLADAYRLQYSAIAGTSPGDEPAAKSLAATVELAAQNGVTTVFFEENLPSELAATVADEIGARISALATAESLNGDQIAAGETYLSLMHRNLEALRSGLSCR